MTGTKPTRHLRSADGLDGNARDRQVGSRFRLRRRSRITLAGMSILNAKIARLDGTPATLGDLTEGRPTLLVNVASRCGLTPQYTGLEELQAHVRRPRLHRPRRPVQPVRRAGAGLGRGDRGVLLGDVRRHLPDDREGRRQRRRPARDLPASWSRAPNEKGRVGDVEWNFEKFLLAADGAVLARFSPRVEPLDRGSSPRSSALEAAPEAAPARLTARLAHVRLGYLALPVMGGDMMALRDRTMALVRAGLPLLRQAGQAQQRPMSEPRRRVRRSACSAVVPWCSAAGRGRALLRRAPGGTPRRALPAPVAHSLFGKGAVHGLDGVEHRAPQAAVPRGHRPRPGRPTSPSGSATKWEVELDRWVRTGRGTVIPSAVRVLGEAVQEWAGVPRGHRSSCADAPATWSRSSTASCGRAARTSAPGWPGVGPTGGPTRPDRGVRPWRAPPADRVGRRGDGLRPRLDR